MKENKNSKKGAGAGSGELLNILQDRFEKNMIRHNGLVWEKVLARLEANPGKLKVLEEMERTGGEPDVIGFDKKSGVFIFCDCSAESPAGPEACAMTMRPWRNGKNINRRAAQKRWRKKWELSC